MLVSGCATKLFYFAPAPQQGQRLVAMKQNQMIEGVQETNNNLALQVLFEPTAQITLFNDMVVFWVYATNINAQPFEYSISNIQLMDRNGRPVPILGIDANRSKASSRYALASWFRAGLETAVFANSTTRGTVSGYNSQGQYFSATYQSTTTDPAVAYSIYQDSNRRIERNNDRLQQAFENAILAVQRLTLTPRILDKAQSAEGIIAVPISRSMPTPNEFRFTVLLGDYSFHHNFTIRDKP